MSASMMHAPFFPDGKLQFGCICEYDTKYYLDDEGNDPFVQEMNYKRERAMRELDQHSGVWKEVETKKYVDGETKFETHYEYKPGTYEEREEKEEDFAMKRYRYVQQLAEKKYEHNDPRKKLYCIVEAMAPQPGFEERAEKELKELDKIYEQNYKKYYPEAHIETPASLGKLVITSEDGKPKFDFYPSDDLKAWSIPELLDPFNSPGKLAAGERSRAHMAGVLEAQESRAYVLWRGNLEKCGWILGRALTNEHIRPAYWSNNHTFWMPVDIEVDAAATGEEVVAYRQYLRADKALTRNVQGVISQLNKGEENRCWSSTDITTVSNWHDIRILFLRYLRHHSGQWDVVLPEAPAPPKSLVRRVRDSPALNGTNLVILTLVMALLGLLAMFGYLIFFKGVRVL